MKPNLADCLYLTSSCAQFRITTDSMLLAGDDINIHHKKVSVCAPKKRSRLLRACNELFLVKMFISLALIIFQLNNDDNVAE